MITKEQFMGSLSKEFSIIKHLAEKITPEQMSFKPTDAQRTTGELMHYLSYVFVAAVETIVSGDKNVYKKYSEETPQPTIENFASMIDKEEARIRELVMPLTEEQLDEEVDMWSKQTRAMHLFNGPLKWSVAYKMQLFLYIKQSGTPNIGTMNLWAGMDQPPK